MRRLALALFAAALIGCGGGGSGSDSAASSSCARRAPIGVAVVNGWPGVDPEPYATALEENCQGLVEIEAFPWFDRYGACDSAHPGLCTETFPEKRHAFIRAMAAHGVTTYVVSENSNAYGPAHLSDDAFREVIRELREQAASVKADRVWLGAPSEPWAAPDVAHRRARLARAEWPGTFVIPDAGQNHATGRPYWTDVAYDYLEVHPCSLEAARESIAMGLPILTVTDCGPVLNPGPAASAELARGAVGYGVPLVIYDFAAFAPDLPTITAVGAAIRGD